MPSSRPRRRAPPRRRATDSATAMTASDASPIPSRPWSRDRAVRDRRSSHPDIRARPGLPTRSTCAQSLSPSERSWPSRCCATAGPSASLSAAARVRPFTAKQIALLEDLRRPGGHRHRERPPVQGAKTRNGSERGAGAADGDGRDPAGHRLLADRLEPVLRADRGERRPALRGAVGCIFRVRGRAGCARRRSRRRAARRLATPRRPFARDA